MSSHPRPLSSIPRDPCRCRALFRLLMLASFSPARRRRAVRGRTVLGLVRGQIRFHAWPPELPWHSVDSMGCHVPCTGGYVPCMCHTAAAGGVSGLPARHSLLSMYFTEA